MEKLESSKLPDELLKVIGDLPDKSISKSNEQKDLKRKSKREALAKPTKVRFIESELPKSTVSDFMPLKSYKYFQLTLNEILELML